MSNDDTRETTPSSSLPATRRTLLASVAGIAGLAGCGSSNDGGDEGDDGDGSDGDGGDDGSDSDFSIESRCQVDLTPSEVAVVSCQSEADQGDLLITTVLRNESQQTINVFENRYEVRVYEEDEEVVEDSMSELEYDITANRHTQFPEGREVEPGETLPVTHRIGLDESKTPEDVEFYTITIRRR
jgi:hypothetical protein